MTFDWPRRAVAGVVALLLVSNVAALAVIDNGDSTTIEAQRPGKSKKLGKATPPKEWDPRVVDLAKFVEEARQLRYKHPVAVSFLSEADYLEAVGGEQDAELSKQEKADIATFSGQARALGLLPKTTDLLEVTKAIVDEGTLAFYDSDDKRMVVRGTEITVGVRGTVVHELTHALQDQRFDIGREFEADGTSTIFQALIEGDAVRIEDLYVEQLGETEQKQYFAEQESVQEAADFSEIPPALIQLFAAPYVLGAPMTKVVVEERGQSELDRLFRNPPKSDEAMINPFALLDRDTNVKVARPKLKDGEKETDDGDFGSVSWYVVLASFIDIRTALQAVDGWAGDNYVGYKKAGRECLRIHFRGDTAADDNEMTAALQEWRKSFPPDRVTVTRLRPGTELDACEPDKVPTPRPEADFAIGLPQACLDVVAQVLKEGASVAVARCFAREFVALVDLKALTSGSEADQAGLIKLGEAIAGKCITRR